MSFFGNLLRSVTGSKRGGMNFPPRPVGILAPALTVGVIQQNNDVGVLSPSNDTLGVLSASPDKPSGFNIGNIIGTIGSVVDIASKVDDMVSKPSENTVQGGELGEVVVTATPVKPPNFVDKVKKKADDLANGKPLVTMGQEFSMADNLKIPVYIGLALLAYKFVIKGGR